MDRRRCCFVRMRFGQLTKMLDLIKSVEEAWRKYNEASECNELIHIELFANMRRKIHTDAPSFHPWFCFIYGYLQNAPVETASSKSKKRSLTFMLPTTLPEARKYCIFYTFNIVGNAMIGSYLYPDTQELFIFYICDLISIHMYSTNVRRPIC